MRAGVHATIIGKPNAGKSSLMNLLLGADRAIVTAIAGTTRDVIEDSVQLGAYALVLNDTAGVRQSTDDVERIGIERTLRSARAAPRRADEKDRRAHLRRRRVAARVT
jgi:tRNA modification GTPase